jgi:hypothetical protein
MSVSANSKIGVTVTSRKVVFYFGVVFCCDHGIKFGDALAFACACGSFRVGCIGDDSLTGG